MARETNVIRDKTRRVKDHILNRFLKLAEMQETAVQMSEGEKTQYNDLMLTFARNVIPRTQEITGEDGQALVIEIAKETADKNDISSSTSTDSEGQTQIQSS